MTLQLLAVLTAAGGMALVALTHNATPVYFMFAALVAVVVVSYVSSRVSVRALGWRREAADRVYEEEPFTVRVELTNRGRLPRFLLTLRDTTPPYLEAEEAAEFVVSALWPGEKVSLAYQARARKRGVYTVGPISTWASDPFGVFQQRAALEARAEVIIYPRPLALSGHFGRSELGAGGTGAGEQARIHEAGLDFYGVRDYQPGDELRRIHWPATAHHGRLTVIEFDRGSTENLAVVLDTRAGTEFGRGAETTLEVGVKVAASLIHWALVSEGSAVVVADSAEGPRWVGVERLDHEYEALELLARARADGSMPVSALLEWAAASLPSGATVFTVTAAPDAALPGLVEALERRHLHTAVIVLDSHSFDSRAGYATEAMEALSAAGAVTVMVRRGDDLTEALERALVARS